MSSFSYTWLNILYVPLANPDEKLWGKKILQDPPEHLEYLAFPGIRQSAPISGPNYFCAFWVPQSPIGLISAEIGALCFIPGHANQLAYYIDINSRLESGVLAKGYAIGYDVCGGGGG